MSSGSDTFLLNQEIQRQADELAKVAELTVRLERAYEKIATKLADERKLLLKIRDLIDVALACGLDDGG